MRVEPLYLKQVAAAGVVLVAVPVAVSVAVYSNSSSNSNSNSSSSRSSRPRSRSHSSERVCIWKKFLEEEYFNCAPRALLHTFLLNIYNTFVN